MGVLTQYEADQMADGPAMPPVSQPGQPMPSKRTKVVKPQKPNRP